MLTDRPTDIVLTELLDALPDAVIWMRAIRDEANRVINFQIDYANQKAQDTLEGSHPVRIGAQLLHTNRHEQKDSETDFRGMCVALETNQLHEFSYFNFSINSWILTSWSKVNDGILSVTRTLLKTDNPVKSAQAAADLQAVIDSSQTGIFVFGPVYDKTGKLIDFRFKTINRMVAQLVGQTPDKLTGEVASNWFISYRETGLFDRYRHTYDTGEEQRFDIHYNVDGFDVWFDVKSIKFGDDVLVTFTDYTSVKQANQNVERQADLLNSVLNGAINGIMAFEAIRDDEGIIQDFTFLSANEASCQLVGKSAQELIGSTMLTSFPGNAQTGLFDHYVHTTETGQPVRTETYYKHDGLDIWFDISTQKLGDGFVVTFTDVSIVKRAAAAVEQSADELRTVIDSAQVAIYLINPVRNEKDQIVDFRFRTANQMLANYVGLEPDALTNELVSRWFPAYVENGLFDRYIAVYETGRTQHFNIHYKTDRVDVWINVTATKRGNDLLITFSDYTDLKKLQQRLEASATELQTIIDTSQTGIFLLSPVRNETGDVVDFRFRVANRQLSSYVGQQPETVVGALGSRWFPDYKTNGLFDAYCKTYVTGESQRFDFHYDSGGIDVWLDIMTTKLGDEVLVTFGDYTPLKQLQQQLENSVIDLQRSNKNLEQFAYVASHDLQEPLRKIQAFGDILQSQYAPVIGDNGADMIGRMQSAAARMQVLIKDVLAYSRITTNRETVGPVDLNQVMGEVLTDLDTAIADKQATITIDPLPTVRGDNAQLRQLFQNLISNALKFTKTATTAASPAITVTTQQMCGRDLSGMSIPSTDADRPFHLIELADNGIGFDPHQAERIFQVFQRLHSRSAYQGTGIGLAIVQKVVENHHGYISAEGRPDEGATFRVALPASVV